jgi:hypothetical protein
MSDNASTYDPYEDPDAPLGTVRWFGPSWGAPVNREAALVDTPVGRDCVMGDGPIKAEDRGVTVPYLSSTHQDVAVYHLPCFLEQMGLTDDLSKTTS